MQKILCVLAVFFFVTGCAATSTQNDPARIQHIRFGILKVNEAGHYDVETQTTTIPKKLKDTGFRYGLVFDNPTGQDITRYVVAHLPSDPKDVTGGFRKSAPKTLVTDPQRSSSPIQCNYFWFDEGDPSGTYSIDLFVNNKKIYSVTFEVN